MLRKIPSFLPRMNKSHRPFFYRDKRVLLSFMLSIPITYFFGFFPGVLAHLGSGVFWDIWFFSYKRVKESDITPQAWFEYTGVAPEQLDQYSNVFMWLRHGAFVVCSLSTIADIFMNFGVAYIFTFGMTYFIFRVITGQYLVYKKMIYPWIAAKFQIEGQKSPDQFDPLGFAKKNEYINPSSSILNDFGNPSNPIGFFNPTSPNYLFRN